MAVDTRQKRQAAAHEGMPFFGGGVHPSGTIGQAQRQAAAWSYSGILASALTPILLPSIRRIFALDDARKVFQFDDGRRVFEG